MAERQVIRRSLRKFWIKFYCSQKSESKFITFCKFPKMLMSPLLPLYDSEKQLRYFRLSCGYSGEQSCCLRARQIDLRDLLKFVNKRIYFETQKINLKFWKDYNPSPQENFVFHSIFKWMWRSSFVISQNWESCEKILINKHCQII